MNALDRVRIPKARPLPCGGLVVAQSWLSGADPVRCTAGCDHARWEAAAAMPSRLKVNVAKAAAASWVWALGYLLILNVFGVPAHGGSGGQLHLFGTDLGIWKLGGALSGWEVIAFASFAVAIALACVFPALPAYEGAPIGRG